jgi:hypothetical protein
MEAIDLSESSLAAANAAQIPELNAAFWDAAQVGLAAPAADLGGTWR